MFKSIKGTIRWQPRGTLAWPLISQGFFAMKNFKQTSHSEWMSVRAKSQIDCPEDSSGIATKHPMSAHWLDTEGKKTRKYLSHLPAGFPLLQRCSHVHMWRVKSRTSANTRLSLVLSRCTLRLGSLGMIATGICAADVKANRGKQQCWCKLLICIIHSVHCSPFKTTVF